MADQQTNGTVNNAGAAADNQASGAAATPPNPFSATGTQLTANPQSTQINGVGSTQSQAPTPNPGLLANAMGSTSTVGFNSAPITNTTAATETVPTQADVNTQLASTLSQNSPVLQQAQLTADQQSQSRGLLNSSMAQQAGQAAVISAALPIAEQNAATQASAASLNTQNQQQANLANQGAQNAGAQFNSQGLLTAAQQNSSALNSNVSTQLNNSLQTALQGANSNEQSTLQNANSATQLSLGNIQSTYQTLISTNSQAASMWNTVQGNLNAILLNPSLDATAKTTAMQDQVGYLQNGMNTMSAITGLNLGSIISPQAAGNNMGGNNTATDATSGAGTATATTGGTSGAGGALPPGVPSGAQRVGNNLYSYNGQLYDQNGLPTSI